MDPILTPLLIVVLGNLAHELIAEACKDYLKDKLKSVFGWLEKLGERDKVELAYRDAMEQAYSACLEMLLLNIKSSGYTDEELREYRSSIRAFIKDREVADELLNAVREPSRQELPSPDILRARWKALGGQELPSEMLWNAVAIAFRRQTLKRIILSDELRDLLNAQNLQELKELIERQGGVKVQVRRDKYSQRMRTKFSPVDLANLMPAYADDPGRIIIRDVFVAQNLREDPPPIEIPKDLAERLGKVPRHEIGDKIQEDIDEQQLERLRTSYVNQSPKPALEVITTPRYRLLVLTGDPGSGKSTLMRYLLASIVEPPVAHQTNTPLPWTLAFKDTFPLLIELRDFHALRQRGECDSFLEYVAFMGKTDQWHLDDHAVHYYLENGPSLVMFDGLDEIFEGADRERVMQEIAGFAQRYSRARIIVTSRPVGYKEQILRDAGFVHFGIQDLTDQQIETFVSGWFTLTFPQQLEHARQRIDRVLVSVKQSKPIRLLAGNPMLLTIMALLAREEELPRERAKFYEKAVEVLCHHWDANRNLDLPQDRYLNADDKKALLRRIAMHMQAGTTGLKGNIIHEEDLVQEIQAFLTEEQWQPNLAEAKKAARRMIQQLRERNYILCLRGPLLYGFVHRTFLEYLTAAEFVRRFDRQPQQMTIDELVELFEQHYPDDDWREVLRLICGQIDEQFVGRIIEHLATRQDLKKWDGHMPLPEIPLSIWCLSEVRVVSRFDSLVRLLYEKMITLASSSSSFFWEPTTIWEEVLRAAREVSWPSVEYVKNRILSVLPELSPYCTAQTFLPRLFAIVSDNRGDLDPLINWTLGRAPDFVRSAALHALADKWPDDATRTLLTERAVQDENDGPRNAALRTLSDKWPNELTRTLLTERAVQDASEYTRSAALDELADKWPDELTRTLLTERAVKDESEATRTAVLNALGNKWPDEATRRLVSDRAIHDRGVDSRSAALQILTEKWPDEETLNLLSQRARVDGVAASRYGGSHSRFGLLLFTTDLDGLGPYLDPADPVPRVHIKRAAKKAGVDASIQETVRSLSAYMGWDIEKGSAA